MAEPALAVHGGAGRDVPGDEGPRGAGLERAADAGWAVLRSGGSALDAVIAAVVVLEDDPVFNAGTGSALAEDGGIETDASVMEGTTLRAGAVGAVVGVRNPVRLAGAVLSEGREVLRVGPPAVALAMRHGLAVVVPGTMITAAAARRLAARRAAGGETVGAVACDAAGRVAAATSTGGLIGKRRGRIGDSAVIGAGTYADDRLGAVSCTGPGEAIVRLVLGRRALEHVGAGRTPQAAADAVLDELRARLGETAGLIVVAPDGRLGVAYSTEAMATAWRGRAPG